MSQALLRVMLPALVALSLPAAVRAEADPPPNARAAPHVEAAARHFQAGEYEQAAAEFRAAYALDPQRRFLYAVAQAQRLGGDCRAALTTYAAFLATNPTTREADSARQNITRCEAALGVAATQPGASPPPPPAAREESPYAKLEPGPEPGRAVAEPGRAAATRVPKLRLTFEPVPWYKDKAGAALVITGAVLVAGGGAFWGVGKDRVDAAGSATTYGRYADRVALARGLQIAGIACWGVGGALVVAGILRYALRQSTRIRQSYVTLAPLGGGGALAFAGGF